MNQKIENYQIQAYVDDELSSAERLQVETAMETDPELNRNIVQLQELKSRVKQAYQDLPVPEPTLKSEKSPRSSWSLPKAAAASLLLGLLLGVFSAQFIGQPGHSALNTLASGQTIENDKYIIHIDSDDLKKQRSAVQKIEALYARKGSALTVSVISNSKGVKLFDVNNPNSQRLQKLLDQYPNLTLYACQRALQRAMEQGQKIQVMPGVKQSKPAVDALAEKMNSGWNYIKI